MDSQSWIIGVQKAHQGLLVRKGIEENLDIIEDLMASKERKETQDIQGGMGILEQRDRWAILDQKESLGEMEGLDQ